MSETLFADTAADRWLVNLYTRISAAVAPDEPIAPHLLSAVERDLPTLHPHQATMIDESKRFNVVCCGRRFGKTTMGLNILVEPALRGVPAAWFAPTYKMLIPVWRELISLLAPITLRRSETEHRLELVTGGVVEMWSLDDIDGCRGRAYARVVLDEAARVVKLEEAWTKTIRPTLTDDAGDAWFLSTPRGMNYYYTLWSRGDSTDWADWAAWQKPTTDNPYIDPKEVDAARRELPELVFAQEYLAAFIPDAAGVFRRVREAATAIEQTEPVPGHEYAISADWAKHQDFTVLCVWDVTARELVFLDRFQQIDYELQLGRLRALCERYKPIGFIPEKNSIGDVLIERISRQPWAPPAILPFTTTNASKAVAVEAFSLALEQGEVRFIDNPVLIGELHAYSAARSPSGLLRYGAPEGQHDDCVMAAIIGWYAIADVGPVEEIVVVDDPVTVSPY